MISRKITQNVFQIGIAEANMINRSGLTIGGKTPFTGTFANFSTEEYTTKFVNQ
jgi:transketolase C-terminal domain/subunit